MLEFPHSCFLAFVDMYDYFIILWFSYTSLRKKALRNLGAAKGGERSFITCLLLANLLAALPLYLGLKASTAHVPPRRPGCHKGRKFF